MREITISIDVFAALWALREPEEQSENDIIQRLIREHAQMKSLGKRTLPPDLQTENLRKETIKTDATAHAPKEVYTSKKTHGVGLSAGEPEMGKIRWVDDVRSALRALGGSASLQDIYKEVTSRRRDGNRSIPRTLEAIIRRTLEDHSSDSANFRSADFFTNVGRGEWALRDLA